MRKEYVNFNKNVYFVKEICDLESLIGGAIVNLLGKSDNTTLRSQSIQGPEHVVVKTFIDEMISMKADEKFGCKSNI